MDGKKEGAWICILKLLGRTLGHSYSPAIHAQLAGYSYLLYEKEPEELEGFLRSGEFDGLNVTIPYKKTVIPYCAELSDTARAIGAVNTIVRRPDGTLWGGNTDAYGFSMLVQSSGAEVRGKKALVFGSGGASATAQYVLRQMGAREVVVISRHGEDNYENLGRHTDAEIAVNATPVGMYPNTGVSPVDLSRFPKLEAALDVIYNPARTEFLLQAEQLGLKRANGLLMLTAQAKKSCEAFLGAPIADERIAAITKSLAAQMQKHAALLRPKFEAVYAALHAELDGTGVGDWTEPRGGYFVSFDSMEGCAKEIVSRCKKAGLVLTGAGATFPYGKDPHDSNIRIAPSFPACEDLQLAMQVFTCVVKLVSVKKFLADMDAAEGK